MNADGITAIDISCHVVTTIYIVDVTSSYQHTGRITGREGGTVDGFLRNGLFGVARIDIGHTASAIDIVDLHAFRFYGNVNTIIIGHRSLVTTTIEITDQTAFQVPGRTDGHRSLVVTTKHTTNLVSIARWARERGVDAH